MMMMMMMMMMAMAKQKILLSMVSKCVGVWDGLETCEISRPEILN